MSPRPLPGGELYRARSALVVVGPCFREPVSTVRSSRESQTPQISEGGAYRRFVRASAYAGSDCVRTVRRSVTECSQVRSRGAVMRLHFTTPLRPPYSALRQTSGSHVSVRHSPLLRSSESLKNSTMLSRHVSPIVRSQCVQGVGTPRSNSR